MERKGNGAQDGGQAAAARDAEASAAAAAAVSVAATSSSKMKKKERAWVYFLCLVLSLSLCLCSVPGIADGLLLSFSLGASLRPALNCWLCLLLYKIEASYSSRLPREKKEEGKRTSAPFSRKKE